MPLKIVSLWRPANDSVSGTGRRLAGRYSAVPASRKAQLRAIESGLRGLMTASQRGQRAWPCATPSAGGSQTAAHPWQRHSPAARAERVVEAAVSAVDMLARAGNKGAMLSRRPPEKLGGPEL